MVEYLLGDQYESSSDFCKTKIFMKKGFQTLPLHSAKFKNRAAFFNDLLRVLNELKNVN